MADQVSRDDDYDDPSKIVRALLAKVLTEMEAIELLEILISDAASEAADHMERAMLRDD